MDSTPPPEFLSLPASPLFAEASASGPATSAGSSANDPLTAAAEHHSLDAVSSSRNNEDTLPPLNLVARGAAGEGKADGESLLDIGQIMVDFDCMMMSLRPGETGAVWRDPDVGIASTHTMSNTMAGEEVEDHTGDSKVAAAAAVEMSTQEQQGEELDEAATQDNAPALPAVDTLPTG